MSIHPSIHSIITLDRVPSSSATSSSSSSSCDSIYFKRNAPIDDDDDHSRMQLTQHNLTLIGHSHSLKHQQQQQQKILIFSNLSSLFLLPSLPLSLPPPTIPMQFQMQSQSPVQCTGAMHKSHIIISLYRRRHTTSQPHLTNPRPANEISRRKERHIINNNNNNTSIIIGQPTAGWCMLSGMVCAS